MPSRPSAPAHSRRIQLVGWLSARGGVAHTSDARAAGFTAYEMADSVASGLVARVRRSWLTTADCDERRLAAAAVSGRLTCVSLAALRGFWVPAVDGASPKTHIAVSATASRIGTNGVHLHWGRGPAPVGRNMTEDPTLNVLFHIAHCLPQREALAVWESAIRKKAVEPEVLARVSWRSTQAAEIASVASSLSDSGLETHFVDGLRSAGVSVRQQVWIDGHPVDGLVGTSLAIQIDGFTHHSSAADRRRDLAADARLVTRGYAVLRFDYAQVLFDWEFVLATVLAAIAQGAHRRLPSPRH